jgi:hypothetical protein
MGLWVDDHWVGSLDRVSYVQANIANVVAVGRIESYRAVLFPTDVPGVLDNPVGAVGAHQMDCIVDTSVAAVLENIMRSVIELETKSEEQ